MKKFLLFVLLFFTFLSVDYPPVNKIRTQLFDSFTQKMSDSTKMQVNQAAKRIVEQINKKLSLSNQEKKYIEKNLSTNDDTAEFNSKYCTNRNLNMYFQGDRMRQICRIIASEKDKI